MAVCSSCCLIKSYFAELRGEARRYRRNAVTLRLIEFLQTFRGFLCLRLVGLTSLAVESLIEINNGQHDEEAGDEEFKDVHDAVVFDGKRSCCSGV